MPGPLDDSSTAPYYIQIVGNIRYDIDSGKLREGDKLPSLDYQLYPNTSHIHPHMCG